MTSPLLPSSRPGPAAGSSAHAAPTVRPGADVVIRPAAVIPEHAARGVLSWLASNALERGGLWSVGTSTGIWQRYDRPWKGEFGGRGDSQLLGTIYVTYDAPRKYDVLIHRVQVTDHGLMLGWTTRRMVDEILSFVDLSLDTCPREESLPTEYKKDPFQRADAYTRADPNVRQQGSLPSVRVPSREG